MFNSVCLNGLDPGPAEIKHIVFKKVDQPRETESEFIIPDSVQYAIVFINVQPRALTQIAPSSIPSVASTNQGYAQGGLTAVALAQAIRSLGYVAIPCMNSTAMSVPLAMTPDSENLVALAILSPLNGVLMYESTRYSPIYPLSRTSPSALELQNIVRNVGSVRLNVLPEPSAPTKSVPFYRLLKPIPVVIPGLSNGI